MLSGAGMLGAQLVEQQQSGLLGAAAAGKLHVGEAAGPAGWVVRQRSLGPDLQHQPEVLVQVPGELGALPRQHVQLVVGQLGAEHRRALYQSLPQPPSRRFRG